MNAALEIRANRLAWAGLIPFMGSAVLGAVGLWSELLLPIFLVYSAVILSFLGGIHWGLVMARKLDQPERALLLCMLPSLVGWIAVALLPELYALVVLAAAYLLWLNYDLSKVPEPWYERLRKPITFVVAGSHFIWFTVVITALRTLPAS
ncbi:DUF3429 domain-containing protein [Aliidiomarina celeris]|uniref:DUF3429 domain-containing protein n=1 Tax=Aliidiomarina celeris TaxID=2249428 RepID=UPI000DEB6B39|nr:DUF3429 domain-containing protein [Aliidiomarina celeris]